MIVLNTLKHKILYIANVNDLTGSIFIDNNLLWVRSDSRSGACMQSLATARRRNWRLLIEIQYTSKLDGVEDA
jgi:uncharacterized protein (DUF1499 family)